MKNLTKILLLAFACLSIAATAQETFKGTISYAYKLDGAQVEMLKSMMPERMDITYSERGMITETIGGMMAAAAGKIVVDNKNKKAFVLQETQKTAYMIDEEDSVKSMEGMDQPKITKTDETTEILGHTCTKYLAKMNVQGQQMTQVIWATSDFKAPKYDFNDQMAKMMQTYFNEGLQNTLPLKIEFTIPQVGINATLEATEIKEKKIADSEFDIPEGFAVKDMSEMQGF
jgi:hypothetical protein